MKKYLKDVFLGFLIGGTMSVPGVSGGMTAISLGCYGKILTATANLGKRENIYYLLRILLGGILGFFGIAGLINEAFRILPLTMTLLFCAAAGMGIYLLGREALEEKISVNGVLFFLLGLGAVFAVERLPKGGGADSFPWMILWGILLAAGIILPGISTSHLLVVFGLYDNLSNLSEIKNLVPLIPLGVGTGIGMILWTKPLAAAMDRYPSHCRFALLGFAVGSMKALIEPCFENPGISYLLPFQIINGVILAAGSIWALWKMNFAEKKLKKM